MLTYIPQPFCNRSGLLIDNSRPYLNCRRCFLVENTFICRHLPYSRRLTFCLQGSKIVVSFILTPQKKEAFRFLFCALFELEGAGIELIVLAFLGDKVVVVAALYNFALL